MAGEFPTFRYLVDAGDHLIWVDMQWLAFAAENGAAELSEESVIGRRLWDFVAGDETRRLYEDIHSRIRRNGRKVVLPFRCDSPSLQRQMQLTITCKAAGHLFYESLLLRVEPRRHLRVLDANQPRSTSFLIMCSCCRRALLEPLGWLEVEDVSARLGLFESPEVPELRNAICPDCAQPFKNSSDNGTAA